MLCTYYAVLCCTIYYRVTNSECEFKSYIYQRKFDERIYEEKE